MSRMTYHSPGPAPRSRCRMFRDAAGPAARNRSARKGAIRFPEGRGGGLIGCCAIVASGRSKCPGSPRIRLARESTVSGFNRLPCAAGPCPHADSRCCRSSSLRGVRGAFGLLMQVHPFAAPRTHVRAFHQAARPPSPSHEIGLANRWKRQRRGRFDDRTKAAGVRKQDAPLSPDGAI